MSVENNVTLCYTKRNTTQLSLWDEPAPAPILHQIMDVVYLSGRREQYCSAGSYRPESRGEWEWEAGFVGFPTYPEDCPMCNPKGKVMR
jgi:hypothetical protein